jgi:hypothetical protein
MSLDVADDNELPAADAAPPLGFEEQLAEGVVFRDPADAEVDQLPPGSTLAEMLQDERQETEAVEPLIRNKPRDEALAPPVFFFPTGRAENAEFVLEDPQGFRVIVTLRGLTGAAAAGAAERTRESRDEQGRAERTAGESADVEEWGEPVVPLPAPRRGRGGVAE